MPQLRVKIRKVQGEVGGTPPANPWIYEYLEAGQLETVQTGFATPNAALNSVRDRVAAESFASDIIRIQLTIDTTGENE